MKSGTIFWGIILIVGGALMIADNIKLIDFSLRTWWPMLLVIYGMYMVGRSSTADPKAGSDVQKMEVSS